MSPCEFSTSLLHLPDMWGSTVHWNTGWNSKLGSREKNWLSQFMFILLNILIVFWNSTEKLLFPIAETTAYNTVIECTFEITETAEYETTSFSNFSSELFSLVLRIANFSDLFFITDYSSDCRHPMLKEKPEKWKNLWKNEDILLFSSWNILFCTLSFENVFSFEIVSLENYQLNCCHEMLS